ncbi:MAG TPA: hypothetical protein VFA89_23875 [Terriglobales bacterium]|nr:hypothetical protein [Terriglobales bacterium]
MSGLSIVWRNPDPPRVRRQWRMVKSEISWGFYMVQELVPHGTEDRWANVAAMEMRCGGRSANSGPNVSRRQAEETRPA